jgi:hypothetical protein
VLDPAQGAEGARIALSEVLSGDPRSLSRRYEIPLAALEKIKDESKPVAERLAILDQYLNKIGITAGVAASSVTDQAKAFNKVNIELDAFKTNTGAGLADVFEKPAIGLGRLLGLINQNPQAIAELKAMLNGRSSINQGDIDKQIKNSRVADMIDSQSGASDAAFARDKLKGTTIANTAI